MATPTESARVNPSIVDLVGNTPLIRLRRIERDVPGVELYAKAEWQNPGGSVKDRPALRMIQEGLAVGPARARPRDPRRHVRQHRHCLRDDRRGARLQGRRCACPRTSRPNASASCARTAPSLIFTDPLEGSDGAIRMAQKMHASNPANTSTPTSTTTTSTGKRTTTRPGPRSSGRSAAGSRTSSPASAPAARSSASAGGLREFNEEIVLGVGAARFAAARPRRPEAHGVGDRARHLRSEAGG